jgi:hypothetical protein
MLLLLFIFFKQDSLSLPNSFIANSDRAIIVQFSSDLILVNLTESSLIVVDSNLHIKKKSTFVSNRFSEISDLICVNNTQILYANKYEQNLFFLNKFFDKIDQINLSPYLSQIDKLLFYNNYLYVYDFRQEKILKFSYPQMELKQILNKTNNPELSWNNISQMTIWQDSWAIIEDSYLFQINNFDRTISSFYLDNDVKSVAFYKNNLLYFKNDQTLTVYGKIYTDILAFFVSNRIYILNAKVLKKIELF